MRSTGIGSDQVLADTTPHTRPCAVLPPIGRRRTTPHRSRQFHDRSRDVSCANSIGRSRDKRLSQLRHPRSRESSTVQRRENSRSHILLQRNRRPPSRPIDSATDPHRYAANDAAPLTDNGNGSVPRMPQTSVSLQFIQNATNNGEHRPCELTPPTNNSLHQIWQISSDNVKHSMQKPLSTKQRLAPQIES